MTPSFPCNSPLHQLASTPPPPDSVSFFFLFFIIISITFFRFVGRAIFPHPVVFSPGGFRSVIAFISSSRLLQAYVPPVYHAQTPQTHILLSAAFVDNGHLLNFK